jgi:hypothetical protein
MAEPFVDLVSSLGDSQNASNDLARLHTKQYESKFRAMTNSIRLFRVSSCEFVDRGF